VKETAVPVVCCGQPMNLLTPNTTDAANEKHVPVVSQEGNVVTVKVGSVTHPMLDVHYIEWIVLETTNGYQVKNLKPGQEPEATFVLAEGEEVVNAYEYCNLHSLWSVK
jgi:superoxide reductase